MPTRPAEHFIQLETFSTGVLEVIAHELRFLRGMNRVCFSPSAHSRQYVAGDYPLLGYTVAARKPVHLFLTEPGDYGLRPLQEIVHVTLRETTHAHEDIDLDGWRCPYGEVQRRLVEPFGHRLAESMIRQIRSIGGGEMFVSAERPPVQESAASRCVVATNEELGLSLRSTLWGQPDGSTRLYVDMLWGIGDSWDSRRRLAL